MMKKMVILLTILMTSSVIYSSVKAENISFTKNPYTCWDVADATVAAFQAANLKMRHIATYAAEYKVWEAAYDGCMGQ